MLLPRMTPFALLVFLFALFSLTHAEGHSKRRQERGLVDDLKKKICELRDKIKETLKDIKEILEKIKTATGEALEVLKKKLEEAKKLLQELKDELIEVLKKLWDELFGKRRRKRHENINESNAMAHAEEICTSGRFIGDPHFLIPVEGSEVPVCFDMYGSEGQIYEFFSDKKTGVVLNGRLTSGKKKSQEAHYLGEMTILKDGHSVYMAPHVIKVDNGSEIEWNDQDVMKPIQMTMSRKIVDILEFSNAISVSVRTNVFGGLDLDVFVSKEADYDIIGGLLGEAIKCLGSVEVEDENEAIINICGGRKINADLILRNQRRTKCWHVPFDTMFVGQDFVPPCLFCPREEKKAKKEKSESD